MDADPEAVARGIVLRQLTMAPRTRAELAGKLAAKDVPEDVAASVLDRMEEVRLVDDKAFAAGWVRARQQGKGLSRRAIAGELRRKGVDDAVALEALESVGADDEREAAAALVTRRLRTTRGLERTVRTRRLVAMLARKGYSGSLAMSVVREAIDAEAAGDDGPAVNDRVV